MSGEPAVHRGGIYLVDLGPEPGRGEEPVGAARYRPALVVQNDLGNAAAATTIVVLLTSRRASQTYPFQVDLPAGVLGRAGVILCEQIRTVSLERVDRRLLADCPAHVMEEVDEALRVSLGL